jgi:hypothetical protein
MSKTVVSKKIIICEIKEIIKNKFTTKYKIKKRDTLKPTLNDVIR